MTDTPSENPFETTAETRDNMPPAEDIDGEDATLDAGFSEEASAAASPSVEDQLAEAQNLYHRTLAEMENLRKRQQRELGEMARYACIPLLRDLLPIMDNLQRAIQVASQSGEGASLLEGVKMVMQQFTNTLQQHGCQPIAAEQQPFDPNVHQAVSQLPSPSHPAGTVMHEVLPGFQLHDRVIRPSRLLIFTSRQHLPILLSRSLLCPPTITSATAASMNLRRCSRLKPMRKLFAPNVTSPSCGEKLEPAAG